jgi:hypothetical protein
MPQRRLNDRYRPLGSAFVIFETPGLYNIGKPKIIKMGPVADISQKGLSVEYYFHKDHENDFHELSLLVPGQGVVVYRMPFQSVSDTVVSKVNKKRIIMRRGIQFGELDEHHSVRLEKFLRTYARCAVPDRRSGYERRYIPKSDEQYHMIPEKEQKCRKRSGKDRRAGADTTF